jgi:hypothetical protein
MCSALFAALSPPRLSRWRLVIPDEAGSGAEPQSIANPASLVIRSGVLAGCHQELAGHFGTDAEGTGQSRIQLLNERSMRSSRVAISSPSSMMRRANILSEMRVATAGSRNADVSGRQLAHSRMNCMRVGRCSSSRT